MVNLGAADQTHGGVTRRSPLHKLYVQVLIAIGVGILLGHFYPSLAVEMKPISDGFISLIRAVVPLIIFATVAVGIAKIGDMRRVGVVGLRAIIYFEGSSSAIWSNRAPASTSIPRIWTKRRWPATSPAPSR